MIVLFVILFIIIISLVMSGGNKTYEYINELQKGYDKANVVIEQQAKKIKELEEELNALKRSGKNAD